MGRRTTRFSSVRLVAEFPDRGEPGNARSNKERKHTAGWINSGPTGPAPARDSPADYSRGLGTGEALASSLAEVCFSCAAADCDFP